MTLGRVAHVQALAGVIVSCCWIRNVTLRQCLSLSRCISYGLNLSLVYIISNQFDFWSHCLIFILIILKKKEKNQTGLKNSKPKVNLNHNIKCCGSILPLVQSGCCPKTHLGLWPKVKSQSG